MRLGPRGIGPGRGLVAPSHASAAAWSPADLAGWLLYLRADSGVTVSSGHVTSWTGTGTVSATGAAATQPVVDVWPGGVSPPAIYWNGANSLATAANVLPTTAGDGFTTFLVCTFEDTAARAPVCTNATSGGIAIAQSAGGDSKLERWKLGVAFDGDGAARTTPLSIILVDQIGATPGSLMYVNGVLVSTTSPNGQISTPSGKHYLGATVSSRFHKGLIAEHGVLSGRAPAQVLAQLMSYSLARYGV